MIPAPYIIVGFYVDPTVPQAAAIVAEIDDEMPVPRSLPFPLGLPDTYALPTTVQTMHDDLQQLAVFLSGKNAQHGGVVHWFAQICDYAWIAGE